MAKKKLLNEAQVRRFMGLAGMDAKLASNLIKEAGIYEDEPVADEEEPVDDMEVDADAESAMPPTEPEAAMEPVADEATVEVSQEIVDGIPMAIQTLQALGDALGAEPAAEEPALGDEEPPLDAGEEAPLGDEAPIAGDDELGAPEKDEEVMENLSGVNLELNEDELVQEVARRVSKRILKAKKAQKELNNALGKK